MTRRAAFILLAIVGLWLSASSAPAADWPQWRGPNRDGALHKFKLPAAWPNEIERAWQVDVGAGKASPVVVGQHVFVFSRRNDDEFIACYNLADGKEIWHKNYPAPYPVNGTVTVNDKGPTSTPAVSGGRVYTLGVSGMLSCWDAETGKSRWQKDFSKQFKHSAPLVGPSSSPLIDGDKCIVYVGGPGPGALVALDAQTGASKWTWEGDGACYSSPVIGVFSEVRQVVTQSRTACIGVDEDSGALLWKIPFTTEYEQNIMTPVIYDESVIFSGFNKGLGRYRVEKQGEEWHTDEVWVTKEVSLYMSSPVASGERLFGFSHRQKGQLFALDVTTGKTLWVEPRPAESAAIVRTGSIIWALITSGDLIAFRDSEKQFEQLARYKVSDTPIWATPVISTSRIVTKDETRLTMWRFDTAAKAVP